MPATTFTATLPDGSTAQRRSETMRYTHAVAALVVPHAYMLDGERIASYLEASRRGAVWGPTGEPARWEVRHWCGSRELAAKAERKALEHAAPSTVLAVVDVSS